MRTYLHRLSLLLGLFVLFGNGSAWAQQLSGTITANPTNFPQGQSVALTVRIENTDTGGATKSIRNVTRSISGFPAGLITASFTLTGTNNAGFSYSDATRTLTLSTIAGPIGTGTVLNTIVTFTPPAAGAFTAVLASAARNNANNADVPNTAPAANRQVTVTVTGPPVANADNISVSYTSVQEIDVLANDEATSGFNRTTVLIGATLPSAKTYTVPVGTAGAGIVFTVNVTNGNITFTNPNRYLGVVTLAYNFQDTATPARTSNTGTLTLTLTNTAPVANNDNGGTTISTATLSNINVLGNDTDANGNATIDNTSVVLTSGTVAPGGKTSVVALGTFTVNANGTINFAPNNSGTGTATVTYTVQDAALVPATSNAATLSVAVTAAPVDVFTTLTGPTPNSFANSSPTGTFTVVFGNNGPGAAPSVSRTVTLGAGATLTPAQLLIITNQSGTVSGQTINFGTVLNQPSGASQTFTFSFTTPTTGTSVVTTSNTTVTGATDPNTAASPGINPNVATSTTSLGGAPVDVQTTITGPATAPAGGFISYFTVTTTNNSGTAASNVDISVSLTPTSLTDISASNQGTYAAGVVTFPRVGSLAPGAFVTRLVQVRVPLTGVSSVQATASSISDSDRNSTDPTPANNNGTLPAARATTTITQEADIAVTVTGPAQALPNAATTYNVLVTNSGPSNATGVTAQLTFSGNKPLSVTLSNGTGSYNAGTGVLTFTIPNSGALAAGSAVGFTVRFAAPAAGSVSATVRTVTATTSTDNFPSNNNGSRAEAQVTTTVMNVLPQNTCALPAVRTNFTFDGTSSINTYYAGTATAVAGQKVLTVSTTVVPTGATPLAAGNLVMIMQMQGASINSENNGAYGDGVVFTPGSLAEPGTGQLSAEAGKYEYGIVAAVSGTSVTMTNNLTNTYTNAAASLTAGQQRYQVVRVPQYQTLTLAANVTNVPAWNGSTGGVFVADVAGAINLGGFSIDLRGKGFRGGAGRQLGGVTGTNGTGAGQNGFLGTDYRTVATANANGSKGEGIAGTPRYVNNNGLLLDNVAEGYPDGSYGRGAPGNAGGGGTDSNPSANDENTGGGGGSNAGFGGVGGDAWNSALAYGGFGGSPFLQAAPSRVILGGGGGAGTSNNGTGTPAAGFATSGAAGGGIALLRASTVNGTGTIDVSGADMTFTAGNDGSGGGGAGGSVVLLAENSLSGVTVLARGGRGGSNTGGGAPHGPGGGGSGGLSFTSSALSGGSSYTAGLNGVTLSNTASPIAYGATSGTTSTPPFRTDVTVPETPLIQASANCVADLTTTLTGPATQLAAGSNSGTFTVTYTNNGPAAGSFATRTVTLPTGASLDAAQQSAITAQGGTFSTTGTGINAVTTISFGVANDVVSGGGSSFTFSFTSPTTAGAATLTSNLTPTAATNEGSNVAPNSATLGLTVGTAPVALNVTNVTLTNTTDRVVLNPNLQGIATTGRTIASYIIVTLPTSGQLFYNGILLTSANTGANSGVLPITDRSLLQFQPAAGFTGNSTFTYQVRDNTSVTSANTATYTIPAPVADVTVSLAGPATLNAGQPSGTFTATFTNEGGSTATAVSRTVTLPEGATLTSAQLAAIPGATTSTAPSGATIINFGPVASLLAFGTSVVQFAFTAPTATGGAALTGNTSTTSSEGANLAPNQAVLLLNTVEAADVTAAISGTTSVVGVVTRATFSVSFNNIGAQTAAGVTRTVQLPTGLTVVDVVFTGDAAGATYDPTTGLVTYATTTSIAPNSPLNSTISFAVPANSPATTATALVNTTTNEGGLRANNSATATVTAFDLTTTLSGTTTAVAGSPMTLFVTTTNNGPNAAPTATQTVTIPSSVALTNLYITNGGTYSFSGGIGTVTFPEPLNPASGVTMTSLAGGQTVTNSITFNAPSASFTPTATVATTATGETNTLNNSAPLTVTVGSGTGTANMATTIVASASIVDAAALVTYTVNTINKGADAAANVVQRVQLLPGLTTTDLKVGGLSGTLNTGTGLIEFATNGARYSPTTGVMTFGTVTSQAAGTTTTNTIEVKVPANTGNAGQLLTTASVSSGSTDPVPADNVSAVVVKVRAPADLVTTIAGPASTIAGLPATYTVTFANNGSGPATSVVQSAQLPAGLSGVVVRDASGTIVSGAYDPATGRVSFPGIASSPAGTAQVYTITLTAPGQNFPVSSAISGLTLDNVATNNAAVLRTTVTENADVAVTITGPATAVQGNPVTYAITTTNNGPSLASGVATTVQLPIGLSGVNMRVGGDLGSQTGNVITFPNTSTYDTTTGLLTLPSVASLPAGSGSQQFVSFAMPTSTSGNISATAAVTTTSTDRVALNNTAGLTTSAAPATTVVADLTTTLTPTTATATAGSALSYTVTYSNAGSGVATNVLPTATLPTGLSAATLTVGGAGTQSGNVVTFGNGASYDPATGLLTFPGIASLAAGAPAVSYTFGFPAPGSGPVGVVSAISSATTDNGPNPNEAGSSILITGSYDVVTALSGPATALPGSVNTYTVTTRNNGPSTATASTTQTVTVPAGSVVTNLPAGATYVSGSGIITFAPVAALPAGSANAVVNSFSVTMPNTGSLALTATVASANETNTANNTATLTTTPGNQAPVAQNIWNATLLGVMSNVVGPAATTGLAISPLNATDQDGSISTYSLLSLPAITQGVLYASGVPATAGQTVNPAQLSFRPASGFVGNATFTYAATDNLSALSNSALYTIPVGQDQGSTFAAFNAGKGGSEVNKYVTGDILAQLFDRNTDVFVPVTVSGVTSGRLFDATSGALLSGASNGLFPAGTTATLISGTLPRGVSLDPATGRIFVSDASRATGLMNNLTAQSYTVTVRTTDLNGGVTDVPVTFSIGASPLPVELTAFEVQAVKADARLSWRTATEKNNDHFDVERSLDGRVYTKIGQVAGQGSKASPTDYAFTDAGIGAKVSGPVYYRLQQVDADGTASFSPVRTVRFGAALPAVLSLRLYPVPAKLSTTLDLSSLPGARTYTVQLTDLSGRLVSRQQLSGGQEHQLNLAGLAAGTYLVQIAGADAQGAPLQVVKRLTVE